MASKKNALTLRITGPDGQVVDTQSDLESVILGSGAGAAIRLSDPSVSNLHVMLKVEKNGVVTAIDLGSEHGTRVGDQQITDPVTLASGDVIRVGGSEIRVMFGGGAELPPPPPKAAVQAQPPAHKTANVAVVQRGLAGTGRNAAILFNDPLPAEATPAEDNKVLQVALLWGDTLINVQHFADGVPVTIGEGKENTFHVYSSGVGAQFNLAASSGSKTVVNIPPEGGVVLASGNSQRSKEQLRQEGRLRAGEGAGRGDSIELGLHDRVQVSLDNVAFMLRYVRPSAAVTVNRMEEADFTFFKITSISIMAAAALILAMMLTPSVNGGASDDIFQNPSKYVKLLVKPEKKVELNVQKLSGAEEGAKAKDEEGKFGKQEAKKQEADPSKKGSPIVDANKREEDRKKVMSAGLLGAFSASGAASNVFGPGGLGSGINNSLGGLKGGAGMGDAQGVGGLGSRGSGAGGGGTGLGLGGLGTKGGGRGAGGHGIDLGGKGKEVTRVIPGKTTVVGGLDKDVIAKVVRRHQNEIKYCYESELQKSPDLAGKIAVMWTIDATGVVSDANVTESTLANATVESCVLSKIRRWRFPEPKGGGVVSVNYPWVFNAAGGVEE